MFVRILLVGFVACLAGIIFSVDSGSRPEVWEDVYAIPFVDKIGHLVLMGMFSFLANLSLHCRSIRVLDRRIMIGTLVVLAIVVMEEFSQAFIATRHCDAADLVADVIGIVLGAAAAKPCQRLRLRRAQIG